MKNHFIACLFYVCCFFTTIFTKSTFSINNQRIKREDKIALCGTFNVQSMKRIHFISNMTNELKTVLITEIPIGRGSVGEVYIGYTEFVQPFGGDNFSPKNCVAIKKVRNYATEIFLNGIQSWIKLQREVPANKRRHIVQLHDYGKIEWNKYIAIMEMGGAQTFYDFLKAGFSVETNVGVLIREMIKPLKEIHQVAIHLDYKPSNLVYVLDPVEQQMLLKLIDFDSALPIPSVHLQQYGRANICAQPAPNAMITPAYICPEYYRAHLVSTKADIWAFGISLYELLLHHPKYKDSIANVDSMVDYIADIHRGWAINGFELSSANFDDEALIEDPRYVEAILCIVQIWIDFPHFGLLIMNVLDLDFVTRMTAIGVLDYLDEKCCPLLVKNDNQIYPNQFKIFNKVTFEHIHLQISKILRQKQSENGEPLCILRLKNAQKLLETFFNKSTEWIDELRMRNAICDTETTTV